MKHMGAYEALHVRDSEKDEKISAVYMTPEGFVTTEADCINIHTRTGNHVAGRGMWSAGCMLVGDGDFSQFSELMDSTYYTLYDEFDVGQKVGVVVINRQRMKKQALCPLPELGRGEQNSGKISANSTGKISRALRRAAAYSSRGDPADGAGHEADDAALRQ